MSFLSKNRDWDDYPEPKPADYLADFTKRHRAPADERFEGELGRLISVFVRQAVEPYVPGSH